MSLYDFPWNVAVFFKLHLQSSTMTTINDQSIAGADPSNNHMGTGCGLSQYFTGNSTQNQYSKQTIGTSN